MREHCKTMRNATPRLGPPPKQGLYDPQFEHDACGVGFVVDMHGRALRDIAVSFEKARRELGFETTLNVDDGVRELVYALKSGLIRNPHDERYRNAQFIVQ